MSVNTKASLAGSSPLTRGKQLDGPARQRPHGLIPAHAGKTTRVLFGSSSSSAHPRSRGENTPQEAIADAAAGSSPLTRGKQLVVKHGRERRGLIPAHAGKTTSTTRSGTNPAAHPRSRGENRASIGAGDLRAGSSPLTRGKLWSLWLVVVGKRLIPAHAGKTRS